MRIAVRICGAAHCRGAGAWRAPSARHRDAGAVAGVRHSQRVPESAQARAIGISIAIAQIGMEFAYILRGRHYKAAAPCRQEERTLELRFAPLFSGSSGNSIYAGCDGGHLLVDAGVSCARVVAELRRIGVGPAQLSGVLVTHEHIDHIRGVGVLSRKFDLPVFATEGTWAAMEEKLGGVSLKNVRVLEPMQDFYLGGMDVMAFGIPHDAAQPVGYTITLGGARLSVATDIGCVRESWLSVAAGSDAVVLESNYDPDMLRAGPYPYALKQRILGRRGHLANDDAGRAAVALAQGGARQIVLGHLSKENNFPELAEKSCALALEGEGVRLGEDVSLCVAQRDGLTGMFAVQMRF